MFFDPCIPTFENIAHVGPCDNSYVAHDRAETDRIKKRQPGQPRQPDNQGNP